MSDIADLQTRCGEWAERTFGATDPARTVTKMRHETGELASALNDRDVERAHEELCDVLITVLVTAHELGVDLAAGVVAKMGINAARTWKRNADGTYSHE